LLHTVSKKEGWQGEAARYVSERLRVSKPQNLPPQTTMVESNHH